MQVTIVRVLDDKLPAAYDEAWFEKKVGAVYEHVYERYGVVN